MRALIFVLICVTCGAVIIFDRHTEPLTIWIYWLVNTLPRNPFREYSPADSRQMSDWNYFVFSQSWPAGYCIFSECTYPRVVNSFNIHGLWPTIWPRTQISDCAGAPLFNKTSLEEIFNDLQREWADERNFKNPWSFWRHEWLKHGSCAIQDVLIPDQPSYFLAALTAKKNIDLEGVFRRTGLKPSNFTEYHTESVLSMIKMDLGVLIELACQWSHDEPAQLVEVRVCLNRDLNLVDCPGVESINSVPSLHSSVHQGWTANCPTTFIFSS